MGKAKAMPRASDDVSELRNSLVKLSQIEGATQYTEVSQSRVLSYLDSENRICAAAGLPEVIQGFEHYVDAGWEAWISLYAFYCANFNILQTRSEADAAVRTAIGDFRWGNFILVTDLVVYYKSNKGVTTAMPDGMNAAAGYFGQCADVINAIQGIVPRPVVITLNTTADIFAANEPLKHYADIFVAGVKSPALVFKSYTFWRNIRKYRQSGGKLTYETESYMWYTLDRRLTRERLFCSAMIKSHTICDLEESITEYLSGTEQDIVRSAEASGIDPAGFRFNPVSEDLKDRVNEKGWTKIEVVSTDLDFRDRTAGIVVHIKTASDQICNQCLHADPAEIEDHGCRERCLKCA
ncbi:unnamed protein product, partial [Effrenium voratum]